MGTMTTGLAVGRKVITVTAHDMAIVDGINVILSDIDGWHNGPGVRRDSTARLWAHGDFSERGWREARYITISGFAWGNTRAEAAGIVDELAASMADGTEGRFIFIDPDHGTRWAEVVLDGQPKTRWGGDLAVEFQLVLKAADPRKYGQPITSSTGISVDGGGLAYPLYFPSGALSYGPAGTPGTLQLANAGTADTAPVHTVTGDMPNGFTITELGTQRRLIYALAVIAGQVIRLDASDGSVMLDGGSDRGAGLVRRDWVRLEKGQTGTWLFEAPGSSGALLTTEVTPAWW